MTECPACGDDVDPDADETVEEVNEVGPGPDSRYFCNVGCAFDYASEQHRGDA